MADVDVDMAMAPGTLGR